MTDVTSGLEPGPITGPQFRPGSARGLALLAGAILCFIAITPLARLTVFPEASVALLWLPAAIFAGLIARLPLLWLPWLTVSVVIAESISGVIQGFPPHSLWLWVIAATSEAVLNGLLIKAVGARLLARPVDLLKFAIAVPVAELLPAMVGGLAVVSAFGSEWFAGFGGFWLGDMSAILVLAPLVMTLRLPRGGLRTIPGRRAAEYGALCALTIGFEAWIILATDSVAGFTLRFALLVPLLGWIGLRFGVAATSAIAPVVVLIAGICAAQSLGPFADTTPNVQLLIPTQVFLVLVCLVAFAAGTLAENEKPAAAVVMAGTGVLLGAILALAAGLQISSASQAGSERAILSQAATQAAAGITPGLRDAGPQAQSAYLMQQAHDRNMALAAVTDPSGRILIASSPELTGETIPAAGADAGSDSGTPPVASQLPFTITMNSAPVAGGPEPVYLGAAALPGGELVRVAFTADALATQSRAAGGLPISAIVLIAAALLAAIAGFAAAWITTARANAQRLAAAFTAEHELARQLEESRQEALALADFRSGFLANMSHEIRTPMNGVIGMSELLLETGLNDRQHEYAATIQSSGEALMRIINDILDISKLEAGKVELEAVPVSPGDVIEDIADLLAGAAFSNGIEIQAVVDSGTAPWVLADPVRLGQIMTNLAGNAVKFTSDGQVILRASSVPASEDTVRLTFAVEDSGIGIPAEVQEKLFEPFVQADSSTTRRFGGTGLGLSIVRQLSELMGGTLLLTSDEGTGSTFSMTFECPVCEAPAASPRASISAADHADLSGLSVLIVDDNAVNIEILSATLIHWGITVTSASSARAALDILRAPGGPFDALILDFYMPEMDGMQLATAISSDPSLAHPPMMMLSSAMGGALSDAELSGAGFSKLVSKPFRQKLLRRSLAEMVQAPLRDGSAAAAGGTGGTSGIAPGRVPVGLRVLVAEDNPVNQRLARAMLAKLGAECTVVGDGAQALDELALRDFDVVLMDCHMPEVDGFDATRELRRREADAGAGAHLPVIAVTASAMESDEIACREAGMDDFLAKPYKLESLTEVLARCAPKR